MYDICMAHIHTEDGQHDVTACAFIIRTDTSEPTLMFHDHRLLHQYLQFGGHVELNETPWATIARELREEAGYELDQLMLLQPKHRITSLTGAVVHPVPFSLMTHRFGSDEHFHSDLSFAFTTNETPRHAPDEGESQRFYCLTRAELVALPAKDIPANVREAGLFVFDHIQKDWQPIDPSAYGLHSPE